MRFPKLLLVPFLLCSACGPAIVEGSVGVEAPQLAYVAPGVEVVADWDAPVFYANDFYWYWDGGVWYRSTVLGGPRVVVRDVPVAVARVHRPWVYAHYRATGRPMRRVPPERFAHNRREMRRR